MDPAAVGVTHRIEPNKRVAPSIPPVEPPTTTVTLPAVGAGAPIGPRPPAAPLVVGSPPPQRRKTGLAIAVAAIVLVLALAAILLTQLVGNDSGNGGSAAGSHSNSPVKKSPSSRPATKSKSSAAKSTEDTTSAPPPSTPQQSSSVANGQPTSAQMTGAIRDYYALLPDDTDTAWSRLTPEYQAQTGGRQAYENFWKSFRSVSTSNLRVDGDTVFADLRYVAKSGGVSTETRSFRLVRQNGVLKIAASSA
jgi:hypothetical protein